MLSQSKRINNGKTAESLWEERYFLYDDSESKIDVKGHADSKAEKNSDEPVYIRIPSQGVYSSERKEEQVGWWFGRVEEVFEDRFTAVLEDLKGVVSITDFDKNELTPSDVKLLAPNINFSFTVTRVDKRDGREYVSKISLGGQPIWTERDSERAEELRKEIFPEEIFDF